jgi:hypothetical protein
MTFSYSGDPSFSDIDAVRFYISDIDASNSFMTDEGIQFLIDNYYLQTGHLLGVAAMAAELIAGQFAREVAVSADGVQVNFASMQQQFNELAASLRAQLAALNLSGDMSSMEVDLSLDPTIAALSFGIGFMDNPDAGTQDYGRQSVHYQDPLESSW